MSSADSKAIGKMDKYGRLSINSEIRKVAGIQGDDYVEMTASMMTGVITIRKAHATESLSGSVINSCAKALSNIIGFPIAICNSKKVLGVFGMDMPNLFFEPKLGDDFVATIQNIDKEWRFEEADKCIATEFLDKLYLFNIEEVHPQLRRFRERMKVLMIRKIDGILENSFFSIVVLNEEGKDFTDYDIFERTNIAMEFASGILADQVRIDEQLPDKM